MARVLLGVTGSVAAIKTPELVTALMGHGHEVKLVATKASTYFFDTSSHRDRLILDEDEWPGDRYQRGNAVRHIELRYWAELFCIAPLDANTLAKLANGLCDNALTCVFRAWDFSKPIVLAPAMNTVMWENPFTARHLNVLTTLTTPSKITIIPPISKVLACGDEGIGAMANLVDILSEINLRC